MFQTNDSFKHPVQFEGDETLWRAVEVLTSKPHYIARVHDPIEDAARTFVLSEAADVVSIAEQGFLGRLLALHLLLPPAPDNAAKNWQCIRVKTIGKSFSNEPVSINLVLCDEHGIQWSGFPMQKTKGVALQFHILAKLED